MNGLKKFEWACTYPGCKYIALMYGEASLNVMIELHLESHRKRAEELTRNYAPTIKDYDKLELTASDRAFLKTRGIKVD